MIKVRLPVHDKGQTEMSDPPNLIKRQLIRKISERP